MSMSLKKSSELTNVKKIFITDQRHDFFKENLSGCSQFLGPTWALSTCSFNKKVTTKETSKQSKKLKYVLAPELWPWSWWSRLGKFGRNYEQSKKWQWALASGDCRAECNLTVLPNKSSLKFQLVVMALCPANQTSSWSLSRTHQSPPT